MFSVFLVGLAGFVGAIAILMTLLRTGLAWRIATDIPNARSLHALPVPRIGAWGIVPVWVVGALLFFHGMTGLVILLSILALVSFLDDRYGLPVAVRFATHITTAVLAVFWLAPSGVPYLPLLGVVVAIVWMTNLFNFMDGSDGMAGGMAFLGFGSYAVLSFLGGDGQLAGAAALVAGASLGFLLFNFYPAKIFMGDAGSIPLGFLAGYWGWLGVVKDLWHWWIPVLVFMPFIFDATLTLLHRASRGERVWEAHREHCYQRLVRLGVGHRKTALIYYVLMLGAGLAACISVSMSDSLQLFLFAGWVLLLSVLSIMLSHRWRQFLKAGQ